MEADYFDFPVKTADNFDFVYSRLPMWCWFCLPPWIASSPSVRFQRSAGSALPAILSSTGLKPGPLRGKFMGTPANCNPLDWQTCHTGTFRRFCCPRYEFCSSRWQFTGTPSQGQHWKGLSKTSTSYVFLGFWLAIHRDWSLPSFRETDVIPAFSNPNHIRNEFHVHPIILISA